jgi:RNA polymerase sigma-70 factor (ECF subfamily)
MIATASICGTLLDDCTVSSLFKALCSRFGGDTAALDEDTTLRLVETAHAGDRMAKQRLYRQHVDGVFRTVRGMLRSDADAEEVTQDAMLTMLTSLDRYSPRTGTRFVAWVTTIAMNTARRRFRRRRPESVDPSELLHIPDDAADPGREADGEKQRKALLTALTELNEREREIVSLRYGSELDATEIAHVLTLEPANVRKILERARTHLGSRIEALLNSTGELT